MDKRFLMALFLAMLLMPTVLGAITVAWNAPTTGDEYNTRPMNRRTIDLNFTITDNNTAASSDTNFRITWRNIHTKQGDSATTVVYDINAFKSDYNKTRASNGLMCVGTTQYGAAITCSLYFTFPIDTTMPQGTYIFDVNAESYCTKCAGAGHGSVDADANASIEIAIQNHLPNREAVAALVRTIGLVFAGGVLIMGLFSIAVLKTDIAKTAILTIVGAVAAAIGSFIIGTVIAAL